MAQLPLLSHCASRSHVLSEAACAAGAISSGDPTTAPASAVRATTRPVLLGLR